MPTHAQTQSTLDQPRMHIAHWVACKHCDRGMVPAEPEGRVLGTSHGVTVRSTRLDARWDRCEVCQGAGRVWRGK